MFSDFSGDPANQKQVKVASVPSFLKDWHNETGKRGEDVGAIVAVLVSSSLLVPSCM